MTEDSATGAESGPRVDSDAGRPAAARAEFESFCVEYRPRLLGFVRKLAGDYEFAESALDTEGVVQDTFTQAWLAWDTIKHPERWIFKVARRMALRQATQQWSREEQLRREWRKLTQIGKDPVHAQAVEHLILEKILELPLNQRVATYLSRVEGWTAKEIAELLGVAPGTAGVHIHRGTKSVADSIGSGEIGDAGPQQAAFLCIDRVAGLRAFVHRNPIYATTLFLIFCVGLPIALGVPADTVTNFILVPFAILRLLQAFSDDEP